MTKHLIIKCATHLTNSFFTVAVIASLIVFSADSILRAQPDNFFDDGTNYNKGPLDLKAQFKNIFCWIETDSYSETLEKKHLLAYMTRLRLSPEFKIADTITAYADYDNEFTTANYITSPEFRQLWPHSSHDYNDLFKNRREIHSGEKHIYEMKIHRAWIKMHGGNFTFTIGRQQIRFGSNAIWNPIDVFTPVSPTNIEGAAEQKGTDAIKAEYFFSPQTVFTVAADQKRTEDSSSLSDLDTDRTGIIAHFKTSAGKTGIELIGGRILKRKIGGIDLSTILFDGQIRGSVLHSRFDDDESGYFTQSSVGYGYTFRFGLNLIAEYFYNQNGMNFKPELKKAYEYSLINGFDENNYHLLKNQTLTANRHYASLAAGYDITPLLRAEVLSIYDFDGKTVFINPSFKYNAGQNIDIIISGMKAFEIDKNRNYESDFDFIKNKPFIYASLTWYII